MQLGIVGLGRMGANIARRLMRAGHACVVYDKDPTPVLTLAVEGATAAATLCLPPRSTTVPILMR